MQKDTPAYAKLSMHCKADNGTAAELLVNGKKHSATILGEGMTLEKA